MELVVKYKINQWIWVDDNEECEISLWEIKKYE